MKNIKIALALLASFCALGTAQAQSNVATNTTKATAQLVASCEMTAQSVNFGNVMLPLTTQSATSNLNVLCNKGATYTIEMTYGGVYGQGYPGDTVYYSTGGQCSGKPIMFGYDVITMNRTAIVCDVPAGAVLGPNGGYYTGSPVSYNYGKMMGAAKGDNIAYSLEVPGKSGVVWNTTNKYTALGTGVSESIPVKATLVPGQSGGSYPIPDMYADTVTAKINF